MAPTEPTPTHPTPTSGSAGCLRPSVGKRENRNPARGTARPVATSTPDPVDPRCQTAATAREGGFDSRGGHYRSFRPIAAAAARARRRYRPARRSASGTGQVNATIAPARYRPHEFGPRRSARLVVRCLINPTDSGESTRCDDHGARAPLPGRATRVRAGGFDSHTGRYAVHGTDSRRKQ